MRIVCYFINYNDSFYIPFLAKHYGKFCERIVMYDQHSTDNSVELAKSFGFEVREFGNDQLNDQVYLDIKNHCWKECRGKGIDYVIVCDADEFVVLPDFYTRTKDPIPKVTGFNMISDSLPVNNIFEIKTGEYNEQYSKQAIFSPDYVEEINFVHGCHKNNMVIHPSMQGVSTLDFGCKLYHFRQIGGVERMIERHLMYAERMSGFNRKFNMGFHYLESPESKRESWKYLQSKATELW